MTAGATRSFSVRPSLFGSSCRYFASAIDEEELHELARLEAVRPDVDPPRASADLAPEDEDEQRAGRRRRRRGRSRGARSAGSRSPRRRSRGSRRRRASRSAGCSRPRGSRATTLVAEYRLMTPMTASAATAMKSVQSKCSRTRPSSPRSFEREPHGRLPAGFVVVRGRRRLGRRRVAQADRLEALVLVHDLHRDRHGDLGARAAVLDEHRHRDLRRLARARGSRTRRGSARGTSRSFGSVVLLRDVAGLRRPGLARDVERGSRAGNAVPFGSFTTS